MNQIISNLNKVPQLFAFGVALILILTAFQISHPAPVLAQSVCDQYAGYYGTCNQKTYNSCSGPYYDGNRAYYNCQATQDGSCTGKIYCAALDQSFTGTYPSNVNNQGQVMAPTCDSVTKVTTCGQTTYDQCNKRFNGTQVYYDCVSSQNNQCQGTIRCESEDLASTVSCPVGTTVGQNSQGTTVCVTNANNNSNNNANSSGSVAIATAQGGAGGSANVTINGLVQGQSQPARVITAGVTTVKQLPKTGLPEIALAGLGLIPLGTGLRGFRKGLKALRANDPSFIWEDRQFKSQT